MARRPSSPSESPSEPSPRPRGADADLVDLPRPPRTSRRITLAVLAVTAVVSATLAWQLLPDARYALHGGAPEDVGRLAELGPSGPSEGGLFEAGRWVRGTGALTDRAVRYRRPLDGDSYRLAQIEGNDRIWVQLRVPEGMAEEHFIPPASYVGRLVPLAAAQLRYGELEDALRQVGGDPQRAWLLVDGEAPATTRWSLALVGMFVGFAIFCCFGFVRLVRPVRDPLP